MRALKDILCMSLDFACTASLTPHISHMLKELVSLFTKEKAKFKVGGWALIQTQIYETSHYTKLPWHTRKSMRFHLLLCLFLPKDLDSSPDVTNFWVLKASHFYSLSMFPHLQKGTNYKKTYLPDLRKDQIRFENYKMKIFVKVDVKELLLISTFIRDSGGRRVSFPSLRWIIRVILCSYPGQPPMIVN